MTAAINKKSLSEEEVKRLSIPAAIEGEIDGITHVRMKRFFMNGRVMNSGKKTSGAAQKEGLHESELSGGLKMQALEDCIRNRLIGTMLARTAFFADALD